MDKQKNIIDFRERLIENFEQIKRTSINYLMEKKFIDQENEINIKNVIRYNKDVELIKKDSGKKEKKGFKLYVVEWESNNQEVEDEKQLTELEFLVEEDRNGNIINIHTIEELIKEYEKDSFKNIKDVVDKTKENEAKPEVEQDKGLKKDSLEELEEEKQKEEQDKKEESTSKEDENKKRKPQHVLETVNTDKAKMDYWNTLKQAFGLPSQVAELAFAYPISSEDKVDYANITIYMLDKDGYIINDLDVDDYFKFDSATGNNPVNDQKVVHGKGEERGTAQLYDNNTMIRLKAAHPSAQHNTYISMEQIDGIGDYRDINVGRQTLHTTDYVEKQVVTHRVRRNFDSEAEKLMKSNAGQYKLKNIYEEAEKHKEEHEEEYIDIENADGLEQTIEACNSSIIPGTNKTWEELSQETGEGIKKLQERFEREFEKGKNSKDILDEIEYDYDMAAHEHKHN